MLLDNAPTSSPRAIQPRVPAFQPKKAFKRGAFSIVININGALNAIPTFFKVSVAAVIHLPEDPPTLSAPPLRHERTRRLAAAYPETYPCGKHGLVGIVGTSRSQGGTHDTVAGVGVLSGAGGRGLGLKGA